MYCYKYFIIFVLFFSCEKLFSQEYNLNESKIDSLRKIYCIDCRNIIAKYKRQPILLMSNMKTRKNFHCKKQYNIPDSLFLTVYPFDADSILVAVPEDVHNSDPKMKVLAKMTSKETGEFANILYNYDYKKVELITIISEGYYKNYPPDIMLEFFRNNHRDYIYLFFDDRKIRIVNYFLDNKNEDVDIYWGEYCEERHSMLIKFFLNNYKYDIH
jgi:hypothetical protein